MQTLILGIGNTILGDDGVGVYVADELASRIKNDNINIMATNVDSLNLLDFIPGNDRLIVIDAILTDKGEPGRIYKLEPGNVYRPSASIISPHHANLITALAMGEVLFPGEMPTRVTIFAVTIEEAAEISEQISAEVKEAIPEVVNLVMAELASEINTPI